jgi:hypothetical protein
MLATVLAVSCGPSGDDGDTSTTEATGSSSGSDGSSATDTSAAASESGNSSGGSDGACPESPPTPGTTCMPDPTPTGFGGADCSWGDDPRPQCRTLASCPDGQWQVTPPDPAICDVPPLPRMCPEVLPATESTCDDANLACWYDGGTVCVCSPCAGGSAYPLCQDIDPPQWACATPPRGCPYPLPQAGDPCEVAGLSCGPSCEQPVVCEDGVWRYSEPVCPICASPDTPIATPSGPRPIAELRVGDLVYSVDDEALVAVPVLRVGNTPVHGHHVLRVSLDDGIALEISAGHPTADGRRFSELEPGSALDDQHRVVAVERVPYLYARTYDILPASSSGTYVAGDVLVGTSLHR